MLTRSRKIIPGSPLRQAASTSLSNTSLACRAEAAWPSLGLIREYSRSALTASINSSVRATEMLKLVNSLLSSLAVMKLRISGWSTLSMPIFAPLRVPPCLTASVAELNTFIKDTGPLATPPVDITRSFLGRRREKEKPVPPPLL